VRPAQFVAAKPRAYAGETAPNYRGVDDLAPPPPRLSTRQAMDAGAAPCARPRGGPQAILSRPTA